MAEKISLINQLEEGISDLQASLDEVSRQLADARNEAQQSQRLATTKQKGSSNDLTLNLFIVVL